MKQPHQKRLRPFRYLVFLLFLVVTGSLYAGLFQKNKSASSDKVKNKEGDFIRGATVWANTCGRCHNFRDAKELRDDQWKVTISHMRVRAGLTGQEARDVLKFLQESN